MKMDQKPGCVVLAAGSASRFGGNKLTATVEGQALIRRALSAVPAEKLSAVAVVTQYPEILDLAREFSFTPVRNDAPEAGVSRSIALGLAALGDCPGALFLVADQPLLRRESVEALVALWQRQPDGVAALGHGGVRGNPCLFPARLFPELLALRGDRGGSAVIRRHEDVLTLLEVDPRELQDADTPEALERIRAGSTLPSQVK